MTLDPPPEAFTAPGLSLAVSPGVDVHIEAGVWPKNAEATCASATAAALTAAGFGADSVGRVSVSVLLTNDAAMARLNGAFRARAAETDVLSWPSVALDGPVRTLSEIEERAPFQGAPCAAAPTDAASAPGAFFLGDVALGYGVTAKDAAASGAPIERHMAALVVHGVLHLLGYDHQTDAEEAAMTAVERRALEILDGAG